MDCDHLGVLLFCGVLRELIGAFPEDGAMLKQWLAYLFLGAVNIEQTKYLNWNDLNELLGSVVRSPKTQFNLETFAKIQADPALPLIAGLRNTDPGDVGTHVQVSGNSNCDNYRPDSPKT